MIASRMLREAAAMAEMGQFAALLIEVLAEDSGVRAAVQDCVRREASASLRGGRQTRGDRRGRTENR